MNWKPSEDMDREIRRWMKAKGWEVNRRPEYDFDQEVYAWRHKVRGRPSPTLRISQRFLRDSPRSPCWKTWTASGWLRAVFLEEL